VINKEAIAAYENYLRLAPNGFAGAARCKSILEQLKCPTAGISRGFNADRPRIRLSEIICLFLSGFIRENPRHFL
jgi:hypothetical protein